MAVQPSVDQWTLVLQSTDLNFELNEWKEKAETMLNIFFDKSRLFDLFDKENLDEKNSGRINSYTNGYTFNVPYYHHFAYHDRQPKMGILIDVSASFWKHWQQAYQEEFNQTLQLYHVIQMIEDEAYTLRLSRIDLVVDFIDENIDVNRINRSLKDGRSEFRYVEPGKTVSEE